MVGIVLDAGESVEEDGGRFLEVNSMRALTGIAETAQVYKLGGRR